MSERSSHPIDILEELAAQAGVDLDAGRMAELRSICDEEVHVIYRGVSLRQQAAIAAMQALIQTYVPRRRTMQLSPSDELEEQAMHAERIAAVAVVYADRLVAEMEKK